MQKRHAAIMVAIVGLAGCAAPPGGIGDPYQIGNLPDSVVSLAAPGQDLTTARLNPDDNCYWYEYQGPVETTLVPLRAVGGSPICLSQGT